jgi:hypothetical protein
MNFYEEKAERWLEDALAQYGKAEPRTGLEGRVLARLSAEASRSRRRLWWGAFAFGTAVLAITLIWAGHVGRRQVSEVPVTKVDVRAPDRTVAGRTQHRVTQSRRQSTGGDLRSTTPKGDQFPSPLPLTDQEKMLALYVRDFPEKAALVARAQTEFHKQDELEMAAPWPAPKAVSQQE